MIVELAISTTLSGSTLTSGASDTARYVESLRQAAKERVETSHTFGSSLERARQELCEIADECSRPNWDGYGAEAVTADNYLQAYRFLEALPLGFHIPSPGVDPDGDLTFEWHFGPRHTLSVSVSEDGDLHYSALIGPNTSYGTEAFFGTMPDTILQLVSRVSAASRR